MTSGDLLSTERVEVDFALKRTATNDYERLNRNLADLYQQIHQHGKSRRLTNKSVSYQRFLGKPIQQKNHCFANRFVSTEFLKSPTQQPRADPTKKKRLDDFRSCAIKSGWRTEPKAVLTTCSDGSPTPQKPAAGGT